MIGYFYSVVTHGSDALDTAREMARIVLPAEAGEERDLLVSPACDYAGPLDPDVRAVSLLAPLPDEALSHAIIMPPVRYFRDAYGASFLVYAHNAVGEGGSLTVPFHADAVAERTGYWNLDWLTLQLGPPVKILDQEKFAIFERKAAKTAPASVLSLFLRDGYGFAADFFKDRGRAATNDFTDRCSDFLIPPMMPLVADDETSDGCVDLEVELPAFFSKMNYSVSGAGYKTEGLRRLIAQYIDRTTDLRMLDIGGGVGFVDVELLLTHPGMSRVINCEPTITDLPMLRRMYRAFERQLEGRFFVAPCSAQDYPFEEPLDIVCAYASFFYIPREHMRPTLDRAWHALRAGGILVMHENIKRDLFKPRDYYDIMFTVDELESLLSAYGQIDYYRSTDIRPMEREDTKDLTVFRVIQKK